MFRFRNAIERSVNIDTIDDFRYAEFILGINKDDLKSFIEDYAYSENSLENLKIKVNLDCLKVKIITIFAQFLKKNDYNYIFTRIGIHIGQKEIELQPNLKGIITPTTGLNHIDIKIAKDRNIKIISLKNEVHFLESIKSTCQNILGV